jgi:hypothetical protein
MWLLVISCWLFEIKLLTNTDNRQRITDNAKMSDHNQKTIKQAIDEMLKAYHLDEKMRVVRIRAEWEKLFGKMISKHTTRIDLKGDTLYLALDSAVVRNELAMGKEKIKDSLNEALGEKVIREVVLC